MKENKIRVIVGAKYYPNNILFQRIYPEGKEFEGKWKVSIFEEYDMIDEGFSAGSLQNLINLLKLSFDKK